MRLEIKGLAQLRERLERLRIEEVMARALAEQAEKLAEAVRDGLSNAAGSGGHDRPWVQSGALRDSIGAQASGLAASVGSDDPAAAPQELGTSKLPPRPFLAPVAAGMGEGVAAAVGTAVAGALRGDGITPVQFSTESRGSYVPVGPFDAEAHKLLQWLQRPRVGPVQALPPSSEQPNILMHEESAKRPPPDSKPIDETEWSGDHRFKKDLRLGAKGEVRIAPNGDVWTKNPDGTWDNDDSAGDYTGSGKPSGQKGRDRESRRNKRQ